MNMQRGIPIFTDHRYLRFSGFMYIEFVYQDEMFVAKEYDKYFQKVQIEKKDLLYGFIIFSCPVFLFVCFAYIMCITEFFLIEAKEAQWLMQ